MTDDGRYLSLISSLYYFLHRQVNLFIRSMRVNLSIIPLSNATYTHQLFNQTHYIRTKYKKRINSLSLSLLLVVVVVHIRNITEALTFIAHSRILLLLYSFSSSFQPGKTVVIRALPRDFSERAFVAENAD